MLIDSYVMIIDSYRYMEVCDDNRLIWVEAGRNTGMYTYIDPQVFVLIVTVWQVHTCIHTYMYLKAA